MNPVNWDYKFNAPDVYEIDVQKLDSACPCDDCGDPAIVMVSEEFKWGWSKPRPLCESCLEGIGGTL